MNKKERIIKRFNKAHIMLQILSLSFMVGSFVFNEDILFTIALPIQFVALSYLIIDLIYT